MPAGCSTCFSSNCSATAAWKPACSCATGVTVHAWWRPTTLWGNCTGMVTCNIPREVEWAWRAHYMASSVTSTHCWISSYGYTLGNMCMQFLPVISQVSQQDFKLLLQPPMHVVAHTEIHHATHRHVPPNVQHLFRKPLVKCERHSHNR
jgi:hypothetical protein